MAGFLNTLNNTVAQIQQPIAAAATPYLQKITETAMQAAQPVAQPATQRTTEGFGQRIGLLEILLIILLILLICSAYANSQN